MKKFLALFIGAFLSALMFIKSAGASFMTDTATSIGSWTTTEVGSILSGPVGSIIYFVLGLAVIGFVVYVIRGWMHSGTGRK